MVFEADISPVGLETVSGHATVCPQIAKLGFKQHAIHRIFPLQMQRSFGSDLRFGAAIFFFNYVRFVLSFHTFQTVVHRQQHSVAVVFCLWGAFECVFDRLTGAAVLLYRDFRLFSVKCTLD
jgi:hypothetical protein